MRFWDSSALLPLVVREARSRPCRDLYRADPDVVVWTFAPLEVWSGCCRKRREGILDDDAALDQVGARLARAAKRWAPLEDSDAVREEARRLLRSYELRTGDALQLAAAVVWCEGRPRGRMIVAGDDRLLAAARGEGFDVVQPTVP